MASILVVDDSTTMRQMICFTLTSVNHAVTEAPNGVEGLKLAINGKFDLVVSDINMPEMNGIEMVKAIRALPAYKSTPILMLTTESQVEEKQKGRAAGATGWIVKPFNPQALLDILDKVLVA